MNDETMRANEEFEKMGGTKMKTLLVVALVLTGSAMTSHAFQGVVRTDRLGVEFSAPPVIAFLEDPSGKRVGVDFSRTLTIDGQGFEIRELSEANVIQQNIADDDTEPPQLDSETTWSIGIYNRGTQTLVLVARGIAEGIGEFRLVSSGKSFVRDPRIERTMSMFAGPGVERRFEITVDRSQGLLQVKRHATGQTLVQDIDYACQRGLISPEGVCKSLRVKAVAAAEALDRGKVESYRRQLSAFLHELAAQGGKHVLEPALTILREEAEALQNAPSAVKGRPRPASKSKAKRTSVANTQQSGDR